MQIFGFYIPRVSVFFSFLGLSCGLLLVACVDEEDSEIQFTADQIERLLAGDSTKSWKLIRKEIDGEQAITDSCQLENELIFTRGIAPVAGILVFDDSCDVEKVLDGYWEVLNQSNLPVTDTLLYLFNPDTSFIIEDSLVVVEHDTVINIVERITSRFLTISRTEISNRVSVTVTEDYEVHQ